MRDGRTIDSEGERSLSYLHIDKDAQTGEPLGMIERFFIAAPDRLIYVAPRPPRVYRRTTCIRSDGRLGVLHILVSARDRITVVDAATGNADRTDRFERGIPLDTPDPQTPFEQALLGSMFFVDGDRLAIAGTLKPTRMLRFHGSQRVFTCETNEGEMIAAQCGEDAEIGVSRFLLSRCDCAQAAAVAAGKADLRTALTWNGESLVFDVDRNMQIIGGWALPTAKLPHWSLPRPGVFV